MVRFVIVVVEEGIRRGESRGTVGLLNAVGMSRDYSGWRRRRNDASRPSGEHAPGCEHAPVRRFLEQRQPGQVRVRE
ncbi:hypothetical protein, partial [Salmonella enterica]|uniref:hypothetical protein n=1 Tax=Salmonella enterica TaxID=28901 RepID=UPI001A7EA8FE